MGSDFVVEIPRSEFVFVHLGQLLAEQLLWILLGVNYLTKNIRFDIW